MELISRSIKVVAKRMKFDAEKRGKNGLVHHVSKEKRLAEREREKSLITMRDVVVFFCRRSVESSRCLRGYLSFSFATVQTVEGKKERHTGK